MQSELTKDESDWLKRLQNLLNKCPSDRLGFYTIGDPDITVYDKEKDAQIDRIMTECLGRADFCVASDEAGADMATIKFPSAVHSTAG